MMRFAVILLVLGSLAASLVGCTNTVRGLGKDVGSDKVQNYNSRTASEMD